MNSNPPVEELAPGAEELRRQVSVLFCDLAGSTALSGQLDPEDLHAILARYHAVAADAVGRFGGRFHHTYGDGLMVSWGYPRAFEDDAVRAVLAGLEILRSVRQLNEKNPTWRPLSARVAVHTGLAVIADRWIGGQHEVGNLIGETPNLAARLQSAAEPNSLIISEATEDLLRGRFAVTPLPAALHLPGVDRPITSYRVEGMADESLPWPLGDPQVTVDRQQERAQIESAWKAACDRARGQVLVLRGEPGVGKTVLAQYAARLAADSEAEYVIMRCASLQQSDSFYPARRMVERILGTGRLASIRDSRVRLVRYAAGQPDLTEADVALLAALAGVPPGEGVPDVELPPVQRRERTFAVLRDLVAGLAADKPCLLVVEDVQWSDPSTLELLRLICREPPPGMLVLLTVRPDGRELDIDSQEIEVVPLAADDVRRLVELVSPGLDESQAAAVVQRSDGIPLFATELVRYLTRTGPASAEDVPPRLQDLLVARLDLHPAERRLAQVLAVIGPSARRSLVEQVAGLPTAEIRRGLGILVEAGILQDEGPAEDPVYRFRHILLREAAYTSALRARRRELHLRIARALQGPGGIAQASPNRVAHHLEHAGLVTESLGWWRAAAAAAAKVAGHREVVSYLRHLLDLLPAAGEPTGVDEIEVLVALGVSLVALEGYTSDEVAQVHERVRLLFAGQTNDTGPVPAVFYPVWAYHHVRGELDESSLLSSRLWAGHVHGTGTQRALAAGMAGFDLFERGDLRPAAALLEEAAWDEVEPIPETPHEQWSATTVLRGAALWIAGDRERGRDRIEAAIRRAEGLGLPKGPFTRAFVHAYAAWWKLLADDAPGAAVHAKRSYDEAVANGYASWMVAASMHAAAAQARLGEPEPAVQTLLHLLQIWRQAGAEAFRPVFLRWLAEAYAASGDHAAALAVLDEGIAHVQSFGGAVHRAELHRSRGRVLRDLGRSGEAVDEFRRAARLAAGQEARSFELRARIDLVETLPRRESDAERQVLARLIDTFPATLHDADLMLARELGAKR